MSVNVVFVFFPCLFSQLQLVEGVQSKVIPSSPQTTSPSFTPILLSLPFLSVFSPPHLKINNAA